MPRVTLVVKVYEDDGRVTSMEDVELEFEAYDLVDQVTTYFGDLLFRRAIRDEGTY